MFAMAKIMEMDSTEQNKVALYLFNSINYKIKKYVNVNEILDNHKQMFKDICNSKKDVKLWKKINYQFEMKYQMKKLKI